MKKKAAFITIHGMGTTAPDYNANIVETLHQRLGNVFNDLHIGKVYYKGILQTNQERVWNRVAHHVEWHELRKFLLFGFGDAGGLESNKDLLDSSYKKAQVLIAKEMLRARDAMGGDGPILILAQSLGCQIISCYFWDAAMKRKACQDEHCPSESIWHNNTLSHQIDICGERQLTHEEIEFLRGKSFRMFFTTGCNIPIFVAAHAKKEILPICPNKDFEWHNYYDEDDVLGWPLSELSQEYGKVVVDHPMNAAGGFLDWVLKSWNPMSHQEYWMDDEVLDPLEKALRDLLK